MAKLSTIIRRIQDLGFTSYEATAYVSLLEHNPVTRYELSKNSGVPRSAIYTVIHKLSEIGAVSAQSSEPEKYVPLPPEQLFALLGRQFDKKIDNAKKQLKDFEYQMNPDHMWNIIGYENMLIKAQELIGKAKNTLCLSVWAREYDVLKTELEKAVKHGISVCIYSFTELEPMNGIKYFTYNLDEKELETFWSHKIILIIDRSELLMGEADKDSKKKTIWTTNRALIDIAANHIILDITIFGIRFKRDMSDAVALLQNGETTNLDKMLREKFPDIFI